MLFRADFVRQKHVPGSIETNHGSLSKIIGEYSGLALLFGSISIHPASVRWFASSSLDGPILFVVSSYLIVLME
jgi:hypothetical protein